MAGNDNRQQTRIARIVHRIELGDGPIPDGHEAHWLAWQRQLPGWEFCTWTTAELASLPQAGLIARADGPLRQAQIACYAVLHAHGGIWLAPEMMPYFPFDPVWEEELVVCNEVAGEGVCSMAFVAAAPGARALGWALETLQSGELNRNPPNLETGPFLLARALDHGPHRMLAPEAFYPYAKDEPVSRLYGRDLRRAHGIHVWHHERPSGNALLGQTLTRIEQGDLRAANELLGEGNAYAGKPLRELMEAARAQRSQLLEAAKGKLAGARVRIDDPVPLAMLKVAFFVLTEIPDLLVWQIGAGDGLRNDALRPLLVNFDPHALLVEPNPARFTALQENYGANTRIQFAHCAFAPQLGRVVLHAPDPDKLDASLASFAAGLATTTPERVRPLRARVDSSANRAIQAAMTCIEVDGLDVGALLDINPGIQPGIVVLDLGGGEFAFIEQMRAHDVRPFILQYAADTLAPHEAAILNDILQRDYVLLAEGSTVLAYRSDVFTLYCESLYVEHGMPTIYRDAFRLLLGF